jgi:hypothetical protein
VYYLVARRVVLRFFFCKKRNVMPSGWFLGWGANGTQPPTARQASGSQRAKTLQLFLILLIGRYTSWSAESDFNTRVKSTGLPFERSHFYCQRLISRLVAACRSLRIRHPTSSGSRRRCDSSEAGCDFNIWTSAAQFQVGKFIGGQCLSLPKQRN